VAENQRGYCVCTVRDGLSAVLFSPRGFAAVGKGQVALPCPVYPARRQLYVL
jgi:hypothetical protein